MIAKFDHVAIQVDSVDAAMEPFRSMACEVGEVETFPGEGTKEVYIDSGGAGKLLLIEAIGPGPYQDSLAKRGLGLHHVAIGVADVEAFVGSLAGTGWLLHVVSLASMGQANTVWLARPGVPILIEVFRDGPGGVVATEHFVSMVEVPMPDRAGDMLDALGVSGLKRSPDDQVWMTLAGQRVSCSQLCS